MGEQKYATGNRLLFVQIESQTSYELEMFLSEYAGINDNKYHKAMSLYTQIVMRAGNTTGYYLPVKRDDIIYQAKLFRVSIQELTNFYDMATNRGVFDKDKYKKYHILTNSSMQYCFANAKNRTSNWEVSNEYFLDSTIKKLKSDNKCLKFVDKFEKNVDQSTSSVEESREKVKVNESVSTQTSGCDTHTMTLEEFKSLYPLKCKDLPDDFKVPANVDLGIIANAIENSTKFLQNEKIKCMTLQNMCTKYYKRICEGYYDDSVYEANQVKRADQKNNKHIVSEAEAKVWG